MDMHACNCVGPQNGDPLCPCMMRQEQQKNTPPVVVTTVKVHELPGPDRDKYLAGEVRRHLVALNAALDECSKNSIKVDLSVVPNKMDFKNGHVQINSINKKL